MIALYAVLIAALILAVLLFLVYRKAFYSSSGSRGRTLPLPDNEQYTPYRSITDALYYDLEARPFEEIRITSFDGLTLFGRYYHYNDNAPLDIAFHGYRGTAFRDMCGGIQISYAAGHNVLLVDQRAIGKSGGCTITFGIKERRDCLAWIEYARQRFGDDVQILLYGVSMGATTVLMASGLYSGDNVRGIIADCPFSSPKAIITKVCRDMKLPPRLSYPLVALSARLYGGFKLMDTTAAESVRRSRIPMLILHGEDDRFVPAEMSRDIADARPDIERHTFPGAGHGMSAVVHASLYREIVLNFIRRCC